MSNSVDPDETAHYESYHLYLHCLQKPTVIAYGSERVNRCMEIHIVMQKNPQKTTMYICTIQGGGWGEGGGGREHKN